MQHFNYIIVALLVILSSCTSNGVISSSFIIQQDGVFYKEGKPYYFIGANYWYGPILGSLGQGGNRDRLHSELDFMKAKGITNLRVLVGADGPSGQKVKVRPSLQLEPGVYNDTIFDGLTIFVRIREKRYACCIIP